MKAWVSLGVWGLVLFGSFNFALLTRSGEERFTDHGVAAPFSTHRGIVAAQDGQKRNIVLVWLYDHRGCYALLLVDAETGKSEEFPTPLCFGGVIFARHVAVP